MAGRDELVQANDRRDEQIPSSRQVIIGFDSAWTDNSRNPGAVTALVCEDAQTRFLPPRLATFDQAIAFIAEVSQGANYALIAVDQPTVVPNEAGCRPVERVAAGVISRLGGGVQPARRGGGGSAMFGDAAPIWRFLRAVGGAQDPFAAQFADHGRYVVEVFPALALPSIVPEIWDRGRAAKYNPAARLYDRDDWTLVTRGAAAAASGLGEHAIDRFLLDLATVLRPTKGDQDRLDAVICLLIALMWRRRVGDSLVLGDRSSGYMMTPVSRPTRAILEASASQRGVPVDLPWSEEPAAPLLAPEVGTPLAGELPPAAALALPEGQEPPRALRKSSGAVVAAPALRTLLIETARARGLLTYGEVAAAFGFRWTQGFGASLKVALGEVNAENRLHGEPMLMALVVNKQSRLPGQGFYDLLGEGLADLEQRRDLLAREAARCAAWRWSERSDKRDG